MKIGERARRGVYKSRLVATWAAIVIISIHGVACKRVTTENPTPVKFGTTYASGSGPTDKLHSLSVTKATDESATTVTGTISVAAPDGGFATEGTLALQATAAAQATQLTALNMLTQPRTTTSVTVSDSTDTSSYCTKGIWVGVTGDVAVKMLGDSAAVTLKNVPSGTFVPGQFLRIMSTGTTNQSAGTVICFGGTG